MQYQNYVPTFVRIDINREKIRHRGGKIQKYVDAYYCKFSRWQLGDG
jgi:hypothetical protein